MMLKLTFFMVLFFSTANTNAINNDKKITKEHIISNTWNAMFGSLDRSSVHSIYVERFSSDSKTPDRIWVKRPNMYRLETSDGEVIIFDGERAALKKTTKSVGSVQKIELLASSHWLHFEVDIGLFFPAFFDYPSKFKGLRKVEGVLAYELFVSLPLGGHVTYMIDAERYNIIKRVANWEGNPTHRSFENSIETYITFKNLKYPGGFTYLTREGDEMYVKYKNVQINPIVTNDFFQLQDL